MGGLHETRVVNARLKYTDVECEGRMKGKTEEKNEPDMEFGIGTEPDSWYKGNVMLIKDQELF